jgi:hypothetical protein
MGARDKKTNRRKKKNQNEKCQSHWKYLLITILIFSAGVIRFYSQHLTSKTIINLGMMTHTYNPNIQEDELGVPQVQGQCELES